jgi:SNF2 family DNA or RNA helicase
MDDRFGEALMKMFGFEMRSIRAEHMDDMRNPAMSGFQNRGNNVEVLVTSSRLSSQGLNLQQSCWHIIIVEPPRTVSVLAQLIARIHRLGQKRACSVDLFYMQETSDDFL